MELTKYVRKPFLVEAVQITPENIEELSALIGTLKRKPDGTKFIVVDRRLIPNVFKVYPGFWMTKMDENIRCYSPTVFAEQFMTVDEYTGNQVIEKALDALQASVD